MIEDIADVQAEFRPIFAQLLSEFSPPYEIWYEAKHLGSQFGAGVLNSKTSVAVKIPLQTEAGVRTTLLKPFEVDRIREHLSSNANEDLEIQFHERTL